MNYNESFASVQQFAIVKKSCKHPTTIVQAPHDNRASTPRQSCKHSTIIVQALHDFKKIFPAILSSRFAKYVLHFYKHEFLFQQKSVTFFKCHFAMLFK